MTWEQLIAANELLPRKIQFDNDYLHTKWNKDEESRAALIYLMQELYLHLGKNN